MVQYIQEGCSSFRHRLALQKGVYHLEKMQAYEDGEEGVSGQAMPKFSLK